MRGEVLSAFVKLASARAADAAATRDDVDAWASVLEHLVATNARLREQLRHAAALHPDARVAPLRWAGGAADDDAVADVSGDDDAYSQLDDDGDDDDAYSQLEDG